MQQVHIGDWELNFLDARLALPERAVEHVIRDVLPPWERVFPKEGTWVQETVGRPSLIVRLDMVVREDGEVGIFEIEERPSGIGLSMALSRQFDERMRALYGAWSRTFGPVDVVLSSARKRGDESELEKRLGMKMHSGPPEHLNGSLYLVRAEPEEVAYHLLVPRSMSTVRFKGDKEYGHLLGWWHPVPADPKDLPWETGFALKPARGSKLRGVHLFHPDKPNGTITRTKAERLVREGAVHYVQPWIAPERHSFLPDGHFLFRRVFFGWNPESHSWECLGGLWNARPNVRGHGASDAIVGPVECAA